jgi:uronate dehydrogenase
MRVLVTGAAGDIGRALREGLRGRYALLRLSDRAALAPAREGEEIVTADLTDMSAVAGLMSEIDAVVHLGGHAGEADWPTILTNNIGATWNVFEAARLAGVRRVVFASSNHVVGFHPRNRTLKPDAPHRPDTRYGLSKAFGEDLGRLYADKHAMEVVCLRIGSFQERPRETRQLSTWISHGDMVRLVVTALEADEVRFEVFYGVSRNTRSFWNNRRAYALGYEPEDDAEAWAAELIAADPPEPGGALARRLQGGTYCEKEFDGNAERLD